MAATHDKERQLTREIAPKVEGAIPGAEVLAVELAGPDRFTVYIDHAQGVDHALCERVTNVLRRYLDKYSVEVSSPGPERPLRTRDHFAHAVGQTVRVKTKTGRARGQVVQAGERAVKIAANGEPVDIPYEAIVRANLIDEGNQA